MEDIENWLNKLEEKYFEVDKGMGINSVLFQKSLETMRELAGAINNLNETTMEMKITMIGMQNELKENNRAIMELQTKVSEIDNKSKIDWIQFVKQNIINFVAGGGVMYVIIEIIENLSKK